MQQQLSDITIAVVGLGYVGLPLAIEFGKQFRTIGYDLSTGKIESCNRGQDATGEVSEDAFRLATKLTFHSSPEVLADADLIVVAVPTPVDAAHNPDFTPLISSSQTVDS